jgi:hypothetical protein
MSQGLDIKDLDEYVKIAKHFPLDFFTHRIHNADVLISHGSITPNRNNSDDIGMQTSKLPMVFDTRSEKDMDEIMRKEYPEGSVVILLPWRDLGWGLCNMLTIGRSKNCAIYINDGRVSKLHGYFKHTDREGLVYFDNKSTNGTFIRKEELKPETPTPIPYESSIVIANKYKLTYHSAETFYKKVLAKFK